MLREVFGLSLAETKHILGAGNLAERQDVVPGATVYWEASMGEGFYVMQARVKRIAGDTAELEDHKKYRVTDNGLKEVPIEENGIASLKVAFLERPLPERLAALVDFANNRSGVRRSLDLERKAV